MLMKAIEIMVSISSVYAIAQHSRVGRLKQRGYLRREALIFVPS